MFAFTRSMTLGTYIRFIGIITITGLIIFYVQFQARNLIAGPMVTLGESYSPVQHEKHLTLVGKAQNIVKLTLNGKEIHTNAAGDFIHTLILENGYSVIELAAQDRFGRKTSVVKEFVYVPIETEEVATNNGV